MKFFCRESAWSNKFNWVDGKNSFVGFDAEQNCCENFGYEYVKDGKVIPYSEEFPGFNFDTERDPETVLSYEGAKCGYYENGGTVSFRLTHSESGEEMFLVLYNSHNGYYSHGFNMSVGGTDIKSGYI